MSAQSYSSLSHTTQDGLTLHARDYPGAGGAARLPVVCLHGLTRNCLDFDELAPQVAASGRRVLALDVRGRGNSDYDPDPGNYTMSVYAQDVAGLLHALGVARAIFIGTSMGGLITMTLAMRRLDLIGGAILNDVGPVLSERGLARIASYAGQPMLCTNWDEASSHMRSINALAFPANGASEWAKWARRGFAERSDGLLGQRYDPSIATALRSGQLKPSSFGARMAFRRLTSKRPTLLVRGALSDLIEPAQLAWMRKAAPGMEYAEVPEVGHAPMLTEQAASEAISAFLARVD